MADQKEQVKPLTLLAPLPETTRGKGKIVTLHPTQPKILYTNNRTVLIRSLDNPAECVAFTEHKARVNVAKFSPSGYFVASGDDEGKVIVWSWPAMKVRNTIEAGKAIYDLDWDMDSSKLMCAGDGMQFKARVVSADSGNNVGEITMHDKLIMSCSYRKARPFSIMTTSEDLQVNSYAGPPFKFKSTSRQHTRYPNLVRFSPDNSLAITVGSDSKICVYDGATNEFKREFESKENHTGSIFGFAWSPDSKQIITAGGDKTVKLWDVETGSVLQTFTLGSTVGDQQVATAWYANFLVSVSLSGALNFLDTTNVAAPSRVVHGHQSTITAVAIDRAARRLFTSSMTGEICQWDLDAGAGTWLKGNAPEIVVSSLCLSCDGQTLTSLSFDNQARQHNVASGEFGQGTIDLGGQPAAAVAHRSDPTLTFVILRNEKLVALQGGRVIATESLSSEPTAIAMGPDDRIYVAVKGKPVAIIPYTFDGKFTAGTKIAGHDKPVTAMNFSPEGTWLAATDRDNSVYIRDVATFTIKNPSGWRAHTALVNDCSWSPSGTKLATVSNDSHIIVWKDFDKFSSLNRAKIERAHPMGVEKCVFLSDDVLVSIGADRIISLWKV